MRGGHHCFIFHYLKLFKPFLKSHAIAYNIRMGILESDLKRKRRNNQIQRAVLGVVATAGLLSVIAVAPNAIQALGFLMRGNGKKSKHFYNVESSRIRLVQNGFLEYTKDKFLKLTPKGESKLRQLQLRDYKIKKPKRWDKMWRVLIFDIREERKTLRDKVRNTLIAIGFERLQDSVWVYPYDCEDFITLLKADFKVGREIIYIIANSIENDKWLKNKFGLK